MAKTLFLISSYKRLLWLWLLFRFLRINQWWNWPRVLNRITFFTLFNRTWLRRHVHRTLGIINYLLLGQLRKFYYFWFFWRINRRKLAIIYCCRGRKFSCSVNSFRFWRFLNFAVVSIIAHALQIIFYLFKLVN